MTGRLATHPSNTTVCAVQRLSQVLYKRKVAVSLVMGTSENGDGGVTHTFPPSSVAATLQTNCHNAVLSLSALNDKCGANGGAGGS